ncbi:Na+/H+ antiporter subunit E [Candidatus Fermentibacteria bacterium]|nr:Na+/H+ antiporter subunit E [Candidatus Fermentibacteria bacterium]
MKQLLSCVLTLMLWLLLTWSLAPSDIAAGVFFSIVIAVVLSDIYPDNPQAAFEPRRWFWAAVYVPYFFYYMVRANLDVAYRVVHPDMPIRPGIVKVRTTLKGDLGRTALANSITLTPGTLSVDIIDDCLYVHWINVSTLDAEEQTMLIVEKFERILKKIFR